MEPLIKPDLGSPNPATPDAIGIVGLGRVGSHAARQLRTGDAPLRVYDIDREQRIRVLAALRPLDAVAEPNGGPGTTVILATPSGNHAEMALPLLRSGVSVLSTSDAPADVRALLALDAVAKDSGVTVVAGVGLSPGFSCLLAKHVASDFTEVRELSVWTAGTAGPACARRHHQSLKSPGLALIDGQWVEKRAGSGRDLAWFPGSLGARDCYRGDLAEPELLHRLFPDAQRIAARTSANRRDRLTARLPMLRQPHEDGGPGGVRLEVRGMTTGGYHTAVLGCMTFPSVASGIVAAVIANHVHFGGQKGKGIQRDSVPHGAFGAAELFSDPKPILAEVHRRGLVAARFTGST